MSDADHDRKKREAEAMRRILDENLRAPIMSGVDMSTESSWTVARQFNGELTYDIALTPSTSLTGYTIRKPVAPADDLRPTCGYIQHLSRVPDGERWPVLTFRVIGSHEAHSGHGALLTRDGQWRWFEGYAHLCPDECNLSQGQLGDALSAAGIGPGLPWENHSVRMGGAAPITYVEQTTRPAQPKADEWKPKSPTWRGGKPWV